MDVSWTCRDAEGDTSRAPAKQLRRQLRHVRGQRGEALPDLLVQQRGRVRLEGEPVAEQHVQDDAEGPDVRLSAVVARGAIEVEDLGSHVVRRAARGREQLPRLQGGRALVGEWFIRAYRPPSRLQDGLLGLGE